MKRLARPALVVAAVLVVGLATHAGAVATRPAILPDATVVDIGRTPEANPIPRGFVGVSLEYRTLLSAESPAGAGADPVLAQLIRNLAPGQTPIVRVGGDSTDWTWWPVQGLPRPPGVSYSLSSAWTARARALAASTGARLILSINLETGSPAIAAAEARHLMDGIGRPRIEALEIGNEPELYNALPWYHTPAGLPVFGRPAGYGPADYAAEVRPSGEGAARRSAGWTVDRQQWLDRGAGQLIAADPALRMVTFHAYALNPVGDAFRGQHCSA